MLVAGSSPASGCRFVPSRVMVVLTSQARIGPVLVPWSGLFGTGGRIAQSVERWSNKALVMGSSPIVTTELLTGIHSCIHSPQALTATRKRAPKIAPRAGRGPLWTPPSFCFFQDSGPDFGPELNPSIIPSLYILLYHLSGPQGETSLKESRPPM